MSFTHSSALSAFFLLCGSSVWYQLDSRVKFCAVPGQADLKQACLSKPQSSIFLDSLILLAKGRIQRSTPPNPSWNPPGSVPSCLFLFQP